jgi:penicillin-insensitive murein endopeptidase
MRRLGFIATFSLVVGGLVSAHGCQTVDPAPDAPAAERPTPEVNRKRALAVARQQTHDARRAAARAPSVARAVAVTRDLTSEALETSADRVGGWQTPLPEQPPWRQILGDPPPELGSVSLGSVSHGHLLRAEKFPLDGPHHAVIERHRSRHTNWGTDEIVTLLLGAAEDVAEAFPGSTLRVGNLGYADGGDIYWSGSHNNGRDADVAFYARRADSGKRVPTPGLIEFGPDGRATSHPDLVFDVPRNWALVRSLLTGEAQIQWLFISKPLKQSLLEHARRTDEPDDLIRRARSVLHQPTDAPPHADHLHIRVTCSLDDRLRGCIDWGPRWEWVDWYIPELKARALAIGEALSEGDDGQTREALQLLETLRSPYSAEVALRFAVETDSTEGRRRALSVAEEVSMWSATAIHRVAEVLKMETLGEEARRTAYAILRQSDDPMARNVALGRLLDRTLSPSERALAADALRHRMEPGLVPVLLDALREQEPAVRVELESILRRITGAAPADIDWKRARGRAVDGALRAWNDWWERHRREPRERWVRTAFRRQGVDVEDLDQLRALDHLIPLLDEAPAHIAYLAHRRIRAVTDRWVPLEAWGFDRLHGYWSTWWQKNRQRLLAERTTDRPTMN